MEKITVGVVSGGRSGEHEVSLVSAESVIRALNRTKYEIVSIGISKEGRWYCGDSAISWLKGECDKTSVHECFLSSDPTRSGLLIMEGEGVKTLSIDVVFPVLHGSFGEDGSFQGLCELAGLPYVGSGVSASAISMDKIIQKRVHHQAGIPVVDFVSCSVLEWEKQTEEIIVRCEESLGYPVFVKPPNLGSSVGISKVRNCDQLREAIRYALQFDRNAIIEKAVPEPRELEVAVLGNADARATVPGEVVSSNEFYDYDAKYIDGASTIIIPAIVPKDLASRMKAMALHAFHTLGCEGLARVDFLLSKSTGELFLNEVNTMPGFTSISMYPKLWEADGLGYSELLDHLIHFALERHAEKEALSHSYQPKTNWYVLK